MDMICLLIRIPRFCEADLDSMLFMAGMATPSPMPMHARAKSSAGNPKLAARGVNAVAMLHQITPKPSTVLPPYLSAHTPPAT